MRRGNAHSRFAARRGLIAGGAAWLVLACAPAAFGQDEKKKKKSDTPVEKPPVNNPLLMIDAVTAPVAGTPPAQVILTLTVDCGTVENAQKVDNLMPRVYNAVIIELNREPLGRDGRLSDQDIEGLKRRLVFQINRALRGPEIKGVYIRSLQEVPRRGGG